jgi:hypothetical protein
MNKATFSFRTFTTFILAWTFLALVVSGTVLYVSPPARIANWTRWSVVAWTKQQWQAVRTLSAIVFLTGGLFHLLKFNWKAFVAYLRGAAGTSCLSDSWAAHSRQGDRGERVSLESPQTGARIEAIVQMRVTR